MVLLCHRHHRAVHDGGWTVHFDGRTTTWTDPHGRPYTGPPPLADPPDWDGDLPFIHPCDQPEPASRMPEPVAAQPIWASHAREAGSGEPPPF